MSELTAVSLRLAYADPPYPGNAYLYADHPDYAGEVDHGELVQRLLGFDGWALSTESQSLAFVLSLCPQTVQVAAWVKTNAMPFNPDGLGSVRSWEPVVYSPARVSRNRPDRVRDVLHARINNGRMYPGITGTKPEGFAEWIFGLLEAEPGDELADLYPGTGRVGDAWNGWCAQPTLFGLARGGRRAGEHPNVRPGLEGAAA